MSDDEVRSVLRGFAKAVESGDASTVCAYLIGRARTSQGCGDPQREDITPQIQIPIRDGRDLEIVYVDSNSATVTFPHWEAGSHGSSQLPKQTMVLSRIGKEWKITDFQFGVPAH